jgi:hypothetical protein
MTRELPAPEIERWQPLRAGLVDLFYYDQEEFWFRGGRLLLRGNNGTGKSKVLALTLPFLLDGDLSAHRVEPDADPKKRMEWNLLLGGDHPHPERLGYAWLEFGRLDEDGTAHFRTIGCGLKAVAGRGIARHWFFVTSRRVGADLTLVDPTGTALSRDRLDDALDERGTVYDRARDYRRAVDDSLFGLGEQRYGVLVDLLVQLRQPQLSKRPSERALSAALTESLPPLDQAVVADVAEAFRSLEEDRNALEAMTEARDAAVSFLDHYRHYARIASRQGAAVAELQGQLAETTELLRGNQSEQEAARVAVDRAIEARGEANGQRQTLAGQLDLAAERRAEAGETFRRFAATGLLAVGLPRLEIPDPGTQWAPIPAMRLARRVNDELGDVDDADTVWDRAQHRLNTELKTLQDTLSRHGNRASADLQEDGIVVEIEFQGRPATVAQLAEALATEVADRERLLSEREREVLENHLVNEVASTLQELIAAAEAQVAAMNGELESRPTSTGMRLRLLWQPRADGPAGLAAARERLLRQTSDAWAPEDRAAVGDFLQARIAEVRAPDTTGTWLEHLTAAMDYRAWNQFVIQRYQNGQWKSATGPASGGERVLAASVPLFAAASSHYSSAGNPYAPRLITLDEAFAGVDDNARAKYLGLLAAFDLDVVMTSEREWGCYSEVPGLAISQLARADGVPAVLVTNWEWDGRRRTRVDRDLRGADETARDEAGQAGLWG